MTNVLFKITFCPFKFYILIYKVNVMAMIISCAGDSIHTLILILWIRVTFGPAFASHFRYFHQLIYQLISFASKDKLLIIGRGTISKKLLHTVISN